MSTIVSELLTGVKNVVASTISGNISAIAGVISPLFFAAIGVYVCYKAYEIIYSQRDVFMQEISKVIMSFALVGVFTYSGDYYTRYVVVFVLESGADLANAITGNPDVASSVDGLWSELVINLDLFWANSVEELSFSDIGAWFKTGMIYMIGFIGGAVLVLYSALFLCVSTFMVGILLSVGIIFICFALFPATRGMFTAWCGHCLNYILLNLFYTIAFGFVLQTIKKYGSIDPDTVNMMDVATLALVIGISVFLIEQIGTLCSSLTGGVGINGLTPAMGGAMGAAYKASGMRALLGGGRGMANNMANKVGSAIMNKAFSKGTIKGG